MGPQQRFIDGIYEPLGPRDGVASTAIRGTIPADRLPESTEQTVLPDNLQHLSNEVDVTETAVRSAWRLGSNASDITLANTYRFLHDVLAANTAVPNEITQGTGVTAAVNVATSLTLDPPTFIPGGNTTVFTVTQSSITSQWVLAFEFSMSERIVSGQELLQVKNSGESTFANMIGIGNNGLRYAIGTIDNPIDQPGNSALQFGVDYRYIITVRTIRNPDANTVSQIPTVTRIREVLYDGLHHRVVQSQDIDLVYPGTDWDYTQFRLTGDHLTFNNISGWQFDTGAADSLTRDQMVDWVEHHWTEPLGGRVRAASTTDVERIRFLETLEAPRLFVGTTEVTAAGLLSAVQQMKIQGELLTALSVNGPNLLIAKVEANGNIGSETIALSALVPDDSIGTDELSDAMVARLLPTGGTDGQYLSRSGGNPSWVAAPSGSSGDIEELVNWEPTTNTPVEAAGGFQELPSGAAIRALTAADDNKLMVFALYGVNSDSNTDVKRDVASMLTIPASEWRNAASLADNADLSTTPKSTWFCPITYQIMDGWRRGVIGKGANGRPGGAWQAGTDTQGRSPRVTGLTVWLVSGGGTSGGVGGQQDGQQVDSENNVRVGSIGLRFFSDRDRAIVDPQFDLYAASTLGVLEAAVGSRHTGPTIANDVRHSAAIVSNLLSASLPTIYDRSVNTPAPTMNTAFARGMSFPEDPDRTDAVDRREGFAIRDLTPMGGSQQWIGAVTFKPANLDADRVLASFGRFGVNYQTDIVLKANGTIEGRDNGGSRIANLFVSGITIAAGSWNVLAFLLTSQNAQGSSINIQMSVNGRLATGATVGSPDLASTQSLAFGNGLARQTLGDTFRGVMYDAWVTSCLAQTNTVLTGISSSPIGVRAGTANTDSARDAPYGTAFGSLVGRTGMGEYVYQARLLPDLTAAQSFTIDATDGATVLFTPPVDLDRTAAVTFDFSPNGAAWYPVEVRADLIPRKTLADQFTVVTGTQARFVWQQDGLQAIILGEPYSASFNQFQMSFVVDAGTASANRFNIWQNQPTAISIRPSTNIQIRNFRVRPSAI